MTDSDVVERQASCSCGKLVLAVRGEPHRISVCHCLACQRRTGSLFGVQARYMSDAVAIGGRSSTYTRTGDSGNSISFNFCPECGSTVFYTMESRPGAIGIPVGAFSDPGFAAPSVSIYESQRHPWVSVPTDAERCEGPDRGSGFQK